MTTPGFQMDYTDPDSKLNLPSAWVVRISNLNSSDGANPTSQVPTATFVYNIYRNQASYLAGEMPVYPYVKFTVKMSDTTFLSYFATLIPQLSTAADNYLAAVINNPPNGSVII